jgi:hypothetical protein
MNVSKNGVSDLQAFIWLGGRLIYEGGKLEPKYIGEIVSFGFRRGLSLKGYRPKEEELRVMFRDILKEHNSEYLLEIDSRSEGYPYD